MPRNGVDDRLSVRRRLTRPLNLTRPVARRLSANFRVLVFCLVKAAQVSGKMLGVTTRMQYFESSLKDQAFAVVGARLATEGEQAEPQLRTVSEQQATVPRSPGKW